MVVTGSVFVDYCRVDAESVFLIQELLYRLTPLFVRELHACFELCAVPAKPLAGTPTQLLWGIPARGFACDCMRQKQNNFFVDLV